MALYFAAYLWASRRLGRLELAAGSLGVWCVAALLTAFVLPSFSPLFTWPLLAGLAVFALSLARPALTEQPWANVAGVAVVVLVTMLLVAPAVLLFQTLGGRVEALSGGPMMALPVLWVALAAGLVLAFTPFPPFDRAWLLPAGIAAVVLVLVGWTSATSGFDADHPKPNMVIYHLDADTDSAEWLTTADAAFGRGRSGQIDGWTSQFFGDEAEPAEVAAWSAGPEMTTPGYRAPAPAADLPPPALEVLADEAAGDTRHLRLRVTSPRGATNVRMHMDAAPSALTVDGVPADLEGLTLEDGTWLHYLALPPEGIELELAVPAGSPLVIDVHDWSQGLPDLPGVTIEPRPADMVPSAHDLADTTIVRQTYTVD